jgi:hypothetical protein
MYEILGIKLDLIFDCVNRTLQIEVHIPEAKDVWFHFEEATVDTVTDSFDKQLLLDIDGFFQEGSFIWMFYLNNVDDEYGEIIDEEVGKHISGEKGDEKVIGHWMYTREKRAGQLVWNAPEWFVDHCSKEIMEFYGLRNVCKDWFVNSF